jgi:L-ribulose-5-phosphate 3-epimerase
MACIATMQGRLVPPEGAHFQSFPRSRWQDEFALAAQAGLNAIEWIYDAYGEDVNPLSDDQGFSVMRRLMDQSGIVVRSVCADYFMDFPFLRSSQNEQQERIRKMIWLLSRCKQAGITRIVVPFVDVSAIRTKEEEAETLSVLDRLLPSAEQYGVELHLETSLAPEPFAALLEQRPHPLLKANYDSGNSASLGYKPADEFAAYGSRIGSVHIKDRKRGGGTVPPGSGDADFHAVFIGLSRLQYAGDYVLQIARPDPGREVEWLTQHRTWLVGQIEQAAGEAQ